MTLADAASFLSELRDRSVDIEVVGDRIRFGPPGAVSPDLRRRLSACKPGLIAILHEEAMQRGAGDGDRPSIERCAACGQLDFVRPQAGGAWRCARCQPYDMPAAEVAWWPQIVGPLVPLEQVLGEHSETTATLPAKPCRCCGGLVVWRVRSGGDWICDRCHPPQSPPGAMETVAIDAEEVGS